MSTDSLDLEHMEALARAAQMRRGTIHYWPETALALIAAARERDAVVEAVRGVHPAVRPTGNLVTDETPDYCGGDHGGNPPWHHECETIRALNEGGVRKLHFDHADVHAGRPRSLHNWFCCGAMQMGATAEGLCQECDEPFPCPTISALDSATRDGGAE